MWVKLIEIESDMVLYYSQAQEIGQLRGCGNTPIYKYAHIGPDSENSDKECLDPGVNGVGVMNGISHIEYDESWTTSKA